VIKILSIIFVLTLKVTGILCGLPNKLVPFRKLFLVAMNLSLYQQSKKHTKPLSYVSSFNVGPAVK
jgi:hypothetical protein